MQYKLLISGERANFTTLALDTSTKELRILANYTAPFNASWVERSSAQGSVDHLIGLSEGDESGLLYTFDIDREKKSCRITSQQPTLAAPGHFVTLRDSSAIALATYLGGSVALYPFDNKKTRLKDTPRIEILPDFPYKSSGHGPDKVRQRQCHVHQVLEDKRGLLYAPDLGGDRVWILSRKGLKLSIAGWLQCPPGTGARHAVLSPDDSIMYVIGELSHTVLAFDLPAIGATENVAPIPGFNPNVIPPSVHPSHQGKMDSAEILLHPIIPNVLYVSNRWERHITTREPHLDNVPSELPRGDAVAIILLSEDGKAVKEVRHARTGVDVIRGMRISDDGRFVVVVGQEGGGVEVYGVGGSRGEEWTFVAGLKEGLEGGIKHAVWL